MVMFITVIFKAIEVRSDMYHDFHILIMLPSARGAGDIDRDNIRGIVDHKNMFIDSHEPQKIMEWINHDSDIVFLAQHSENSGTIFPKFYRDPDDDLKLIEELTKINRDKQKLIILMLCNEIDVDPVHLFYEQKQKNDKITAEDIKKEIANKVNPLIPKGFSLCDGSGKVEFWLVEPGYKFNIDAGLGSIVVGKEEHAYHPHEHFQKMIRILKRTETLEEYRKKLNVINRSDVTTPYGNIICLHLT